MKIKLYTIILLYNKLNAPIKAALSAFQSYNYNNFIFIDNSGLGLINKIKYNLKKYNLTFFSIVNEKNEGFAKAVNKGINYALKNKAKYILLLNDDAYVDKACIPLLLEYLEKDKQALMAGPTIYYTRKNNLVWITGGYFDKLLSKISIPFKNKKIDFGYFKNFPVQEVEFLTGCVLLIKAQAFKEIGFFDEDLFFYGEDLDFCFRVKKRGFKLLWVPYAFAWHDIDIEKERTNPFTMYNLAKSNIIVRRKNFNKPYFFYYLLLHFSLYTPFRLYQILKGSKNFDSIKAWFKGTWDGINSKKQ